MNIFSLQSALQRNPSNCSWTRIIPAPISIETSFPDPTHFLPVAGISTLKELFVLSFSFWMTMTAYLYSLAWWRVFRTSPWTEFARHLPLIDRTRSPRWIVPSWDATPFENTLWTCKKGFNKNVINSWLHTAFYRPSWIETLYQNLQPVPTAWTSSTQHLLQWMPLKWLLRAPFGDGGTQRKRCC